MEFEQVIDAVVQQCGQVVFCHPDDVGHCCCHLFFMMFIGSGYPLVSVKSHCFGLNCPLVISALDLFLNVIFEHCLTPYGEGITEFSGLAISTVHGIDFCIMVFTKENFLSIPLLNAINFVSGCSMMSYC